MALSAAFSAILVKYSIQAISDLEQIQDQRIMGASEVRQVASGVHKSPVVMAKDLAAIEQLRPNRGNLTQTEEFRLAQSMRVQWRDLHDQLQIVYDLRLGVAKAKNLTFLQRVGAWAQKDPLGDASPMNRLLFWCGFIIALYIMRYWFTRGLTYYLGEAANRLSSDLRIKLFNKLQRLPISYFNEKRAGAIQSVLTNDVNVFENAVGIVRDSLEGPIKMIVSATIIAMLQWRLFAVALLIFPFMIIVIQRNARKMKQAQKVVQENLADVSAMTNESLLGTRIIRAFSAEDSMEVRYRQLVETGFRRQMRAVGYIAKLRPAVELIGAVGLAAVLLLCGFLARGGSLFVADIAAILILLDNINQGFRSIGNVQNTYAQVQAATNHIYDEILSVPDEHVDSRGNKALPTTRGEIEFKNVSFTYPDGTAALKDVSFTIQPGTSLALVGPSGGGKSTIADLMLRFYDPTQGQVLFDGVDVRELNLEWLRSQIGVVPQQTFLFAGTIAENIRMGNPTATDEEVKEAAKAAHADEFVTEIPEAYDTLVHERGVRLSGGQMQRVAIARALVRKPTMLLLDEATSALDAHSEKKVQEALDEVMSQRTTLFIAHRLTTAARADRIAMLRRGEIIEQGSHAELISANGAYAAMYRAFNSGVLAEEIS